MGCCATIPKRSNLQGSYRHAPLTPRASAHSTPDRSTVSQARCATPPLPPRSGPWSTTKRVLGVASRNEQWYTAAGTKDGEHTEPTGPRRRGGFTDFAECPESEIKGPSSLMSRDLKAPDHTTLSRRNQIVVVPPLTRAHDGPIDLIVDSTGLKILGRGEWNAHKHKTSKKRRDWRKLHIGVDAEGFIVAAELTASSRDDASTLPDLLAPLEVPIRRFTADGAYDHRSVYDRASAAGTENVVIVIPPRRSALSAGSTDGPWAQCERLFRGFARSGDGSGRRSRATTAGAR